MKPNVLERVTRDVPTAQPCVVIHYAEVGLKGENRSMFESQLMRNIKRALADAGIGLVRRFHGRFALVLPRDYDWELLESRLKNVFGVAYFAPAVLTEQAIEPIEAAALALMKQMVFQTFRVSTRRSQKAFPYNSQQVNVRIGAAIQKQSGARVDLSHPQRTCYIEIFDRFAILYAERIAGPRGLPVGVSERAVSLLSAGIDSPVASYTIMKRGVRLIFVHFHSVPFTSDASIRNSGRLVRLLTQYQYDSKLYLVPFLEVQQEIMLKAPTDYRVVLYRRFMLRLAERIARRERARALVTGESIAQVASQTLSNLQVINEVTRLPVLRPLSGNDKEEIVEMARKLGTYDISVEPYEDCCSLFVPRHPVTRARLEVVQEAEARLDVEGLIRDALQRAEVVRFRFPEGGTGPTDGTG